MDLDRLIERIQSEIQSKRIGQDFDSASLKNKKHWNAFATPFFVRAARVEARLARGADDGDGWHARAVAHASDALACHRCGARTATMPQLKEHVARCARPVPPELLGDGSEAAG